MKKSVLFILFTVIMVSTVFSLHKYKVSAHSPEEAILKVRNNIGRVVHKLNIDNGELIFYQKDLGNGTIGLSCDFVKKTVWGWKWINGGGHSISQYAGNNHQQLLDSSWTDQYFPAMKGTPFPMLFGLINNAAATNVTISFIENGGNSKAEVIPLKNGQLLWYKQLGESDGKKFELVLSDKNGQQLSFKSIDEEKTFSAGTTKLN
jgi:hypothetical protein